MIRVFVWNEFHSEKKYEAVREIYPNGIHGAIADFLKVDEKLEVLTGTLHDPAQGLPDDVLNRIDVLIWWGHSCHHEVDDDLVARIQKRVHEGMGFIALHSAHMSKPFLSLMGTSGTLQWRHDDRERVWNIMPQHPIAKGIPESFEIEAEEMYGEYFDIPVPEELIFLGWFSGGEVFRAGCTWNRGWGKVFYFQPGHEEYPVYHQSEIQTIIKNAVHWAAPTAWNDRIGAPHSKVSAEERRTSAESS